MIDFSASQRNATFAGLFVSGALFHVKYYDFEDGKTAPKDKYVLVMNPKASDGNAYFYLPTSQVDKYRDNKLFAPSTCVFDGDGTVSTFTRETAIIVVNIRFREYEYFERKYSSSNGSQCTYCETISDAALEQIYLKIVACDRISLAKKRILLPARFFAQG